MPNNDELLSEEDKKKQAATAQKRWPATIILAAPFAFVFLPMYRAARERVNWKAALAMIATFEALMICAELFSVSRGHWVWNPNRTLGIHFFGVPIEEPLLYYWFPPLFVVILMHTFEKLFEKKAGR